ncbi:MAG: hypothetical protein H0U76_27105 [Ktedonobacteraceae bacterium]|nr:hypothetical protein [Ktedonobacteraceae bacterium]
MTERIGKAGQQDLLYQQLIQSIQTSPGSTSSSLRKALIEYVVQADFAEEAPFPPESALPPDLQTYVTKVRRHAYKVTDEDMEQLHRASYDEEAIFEITLSTALGAGTRCLTRGMAALEGISDATTDY